MGKNILKYFCGKWLQKSLVGAERSFFWIDAALQKVPPFFSAVPSEALF